ncbi:DUF6895 family protein [Kitasatospora sp. NPDC127111]|uniref:DUF6895 family protein n=1 Tax=Kitasatospora sp. NPDC127111 TaxID=3345363 RepID=UPI00363D5F07
MPFADTSLRDEYAAAVERVAGRVLHALGGGGDPVAPARPGHGSPASAVSPDAEPPLLTSPPLAAERPLPRAELAAVRVLGPDAFAPTLLAGRAPDAATALTVAQALDVFPAAATDPTRPETALVAAWRDRATTQLLARAGRPTVAPSADHVPSPAPGPDQLGWPGWSVVMAQLSALALPGLDGPVHELARRHDLALARGLVRSMLRRDHRTAARIARWLARTAADGVPARLDLAPVLDRIRLAGDGSARTALDLAIAERLWRQRPLGDGESGNVQLATGRLGKGQRGEGGPGEGGPGEGRLGNGRPGGGRPGESPPPGTPAGHSVRAEGDAGMTGTAVLRTAQQLSAGALRWLHGRYESGLGRFSADATIDLADPDNVYKPLGEAALATGLLLREGVAGTEDSRIARRILDLCWAELREGDLLYERQLRHPLTSDPLEVYVHFARAGLRHRPLEGLLQSLAGVRSVQAMEVMPNRRLAVANARRVIGLAQQPDWSALTAATWLGATPEPWLLDWLTAYHLTHTVFHLTDWGARPDGLPAPIRDYLREWLPAWIEVWLETGEWDLVGELLIVDACIGAPEAGAAAWAALAAVQRADGLVPRDTGPVTEDPEQQLTDHGHTAVVTVVAATITLARALGGAHGGTPGGAPAVA